MFTHLVRMCDLTHFFCRHQAPLLSPTEHFSGHPTISSNDKLRKKYRNNWQSGNLINITNE
jgi:hypothetical protein